MTVVVAAARDEKVIALGQLMGLADVLGGVGMVVGLDPWARASSISRGTEQVPSEKVEWVCRSSLPGASVMGSLSTVWSMCDCLGR